jgi:hypothetical protein
MPTIREVAAGYEAVNAWELEERRERLPRLTVEESIRQYLELWNLARETSPEAEEIFLEQRLACYQTLHRRMEKAAQVMGRVGQD